MADPPWESRRILAPIRGWHETSLPGAVLIAVPKCQGRVSPVFDVAARLLVVRLEGEVEQERREVVLTCRQPEGLARSLRQVRVEVLICGGISQGLRLALERAGISVLADVCGEIESVLTAYRQRRLPSPEFVMPGCCGPAAAWGAKKCGRRMRRRAHQSQARILKGK